MFLDNFFASNMEPDYGRIFDGLSLFELADEWYNETDFISETSYDFDKNNIIDSDDLLEFIDRWINN